MHKTNKWIEAKGKPVRAAECWAKETTTTKKNAEWEKETEAKDFENLITLWYNMVKAEQT